MKILLVDPQGNVPGLNIGIAYLSAVLLNSGHRVRVLDLNNIRWSDPQAKLRQAVAAYLPDMIGFAVQCLTYQSAKENIAFLRGYFNGPVVVGGPEPSVLREKFLSDVPEADIVVVGEAEHTLPELAGVLERGEDLSSVKGIIWKQGKEIIVNPIRPLVKDLDSLPFPNYDVFGVQQLDKYVIMTSRGCPFNCSFCFSYLGRTWRARKPQKCVEEIKLAKRKYGIKMFRVTDPLFNLKPERVEEFCNVILAEKINLPWIVAGIRADKITDRMVRKMVQAGCKIMHIGIESLDPEVFRRIGKQETIEQVREGISIAQKHNIGVSGFMIIGLPGDTLEKTIKSFNEAQKLNLTRFAYASAVPYGGTRLEDWANKHATVYAGSHDISTRENMNDIAFATPEFTREERIKARNIMAIKARNYSLFSKKTDSLLNKVIKRMYMILRYDRENLLQHISKYFQKNKEIEIRQIEKLNESEPVFSRIPDGTWEETSH